jgi:hypothetical protein
VCGLFATLVLYRRQERRLLHVAGA